MFGEVSSSESSISVLVSRVGVLGRWERSAFLLDCNRTGFLTFFNAPGLVTFRWKLTVVCLVDLTVNGCAVRELADLVRLPRDAEFDRLRARFSRDAFWRDSSSASLSARSRADSDRATAFFAFALAEFPISILRFLGEF
jgi:hypothetical protein